MAGEGGDAQLECGGALQGDHVRLSHKQRLGRGGLRIKEEWGSGGEQRAAAEEVGKGGGPAVMRKDELNGEVCLRR